MSDSRVIRLLERGLRHFALGEIDQAVACWKQVVAIDPTDERARDYLRLVAGSQLSGEAAAEAEEALRSAEGATSPGAPSSEASPGRGDARRGTEWAASAATEVTARGIDRWWRQGERGPAMPPVEPGSLPWKEWHSEATFGTGKFPWLEESAAGREEAGSSASGAHVARAEARAVPRSFADRFEEDEPAAEPDPWASGTGEPGEAEVSWDLQVGEDEPLAPAPATTPATGWDLGDSAGAVEVRGASVGGSDALDLLAEPSSRPVAVPRSVCDAATPGPDPKREIETLMRGARELFDLGDFSGSLQLVQKALALDPKHRDALDYLERNQDTLIQMYESRLGSPQARPRVVLRADEIVWLNLDHRAGFVLAQIDGTTSTDDIYALSGLSRLDTARILAELLEQGVIAIDDP